MQRNDKLKTTDMIFLKRGMILLFVILNIIGCSSDVNYQVTFEKSHGTPIDTISWNLKIMQRDSFIYYLYLSEPIMDSTSDEIVCEQLMCFKTKPNSDRVFLCNSPENNLKIDSSYIYHLYNRTVNVKRYSSIINTDMNNSVFDFSKEVGLVYFNSGNWNSQLKLLSIERK
jgi:hypothetical protein